MSNEHELPLDDDPPTLADLWGIAPDATGGVSIEEWVRQQRSEYDTVPLPPVLDPGQVAGDGAALRRQVAALRDHNTRLRRALQYAQAVIRSYEADIQQRPDLVAAGFCQGVIYRTAVAEIQNIANESLDESSAPPGAPGVLAIPRGEEREAMTPLDILQRARARISDPAHYAAQDGAFLADGQRCSVDDPRAVRWSAGAALAAATDFYLLTDAALMTRVYAALATPGTTRDPHARLVAYGARHSHADVLALYDAAIGRLTAPPAAP